MKDVTTRSFNEDVLNNDKPVLIDFWAEWCGPCRMLAPILEKVEQELGDTVQIVKVDTSENRELSERHTVASIPTMILYKNGEELVRWSGVRDQNFIVDTVNEFIN